MEAGRGSRRPGNATTIDVETAERVSARAARPTGVEELFAAGRAHRAVVRLEAVTGPAALRVLRKVRPCAQSRLYRYVRTRRGH